MEIEISSTIWFNSIAEVGEAALKTYLNTKGLGVLGSFVNVGYYLQDISVVTLEGSTTTIPYTIQVKQTDRPDFLLTAYEAAKDLYEGEEPPSTLMDMMVEHRTGRLCAMSMFPLPVAPAWKRFLRT